MLQLKIVHLKGGENAIKTFQDRVHRTNIKDGKISKIQSSKYKHLTCIFIIIKIDNSKQKIILSYISNYIKSLMITILISAYR